MITDNDSLITELLKLREKSHRGMGIFVYNPETGEEHEIVGVKFVEDKVDGNDSSHIVIDPKPFMF